MGALFLAKFFPGNKKVYVSNPTWVNPHQIFTNVGLPVAEYPYWNAETRGLDIDGMKAAISDAPDRSIILLHACAHNPTGVDPTLDQWKDLAALIKQKNHMAFFDSAYQGFASGDLSKDGAQRPQAVRRVGGEPQDDVGPDHRDAQAAARQA